MGKNIKREKRRKGECEIKKEEEDRYGKNLKR
jgi:hypothetical protein